MKISRKKPEHKALSELRNAQCFVFAKSITPVEEGVWMKISEPPRVPSPMEPMPVKISQPTKHSCVNLYTGFYEEFNGNESVVALECEVIVS